ncbi:MAG: hypothetical protein OEU76_08330 [Cyclobacteriaceae bacterium]|nr:hypothetical protein [Cyclobacteriaceae bacterium]
MKTLEMLVKEKMVGLALAIGLLTFVATSCTEDKVDADTTLEDQESVQLDNMDEYYLEDADNLVSNVLEQESGSTGGKIATDDEEDSRLVCAEITRTGTEESGTIIIDFGDGCEDKRGNIRTGKIIVEFSGRWFLPGSFWSIEFVNYTINGVSISGIRRVNNISESEDSLVFEIKMEATIIWPDGTEVTRKIHRKRHRELHDNNILDRLIAYATEDINHPKGRGFSVEILEPLVYSEACAEEGVIIPVEGVKLIKFGNGRRQLTVDYGDGTCDNVVAITNKDGRTWRYEVGK